RPGSNLDAAHLFDHVRRGGREFRQAGSDEAARSARRTSDRICDAGPRIKSLESLDRGTALTARKLVHANLSSVELSVTTHDHYCWRHPFLDRPGRRSGARLSFILGIYGDLGRQTAELIANMPAALA